MKYSYLLFHLNFYLRLIPENCDFQKLQELLSELHLDNTSICLNNIANVEEKTLLGKHQTNP